MSDKCEGEFYSVPPRDHIFRYEWAAKRLEGYKGTVFDIGCGSGYGSLILQKSGLKVVGIDRSKKAIDLADKTGVLAYCEAVLPNSNLPSPPCAFVLMEVVEHNSSGMSILKNIIEVADIALFSVPYMEHPGVNEFHHLSLLSEDSFSWMKPKPSFDRPAEIPLSLLVDWRRE